MLTLIWFSASNDVEADCSNSTYTNKKTETLTCAQGQTSQCFGFSAAASLCACGNIGS
jgi:hypothetical protein